MYSEQSIQFQVGFSQSHFTCTYIDDISCSSIGPCFDLHVFQVIPQVPAYGTVVNYPPAGVAYPPQAQQQAPQPASYYQVPVSNWGGGGQYPGSGGQQQVRTPSDGVVGQPPLQRTHRVKRSMIRPMNDSGSHWGVHRLLSTGNLVLNLFTTRNYGPPGLRCSLRLQGGRYRYYV